MYRLYTNFKPLSCSSAPYLSPTDCVPGGFQVLSFTGILLARQIVYSLYFLLQTYRLTSSPLLSYIVLHLFSCFMDAILLLPA